MAEPSAATQVGGTTPMWQAWLEKWLQQNGATVTNGGADGKSITEQLWKGELEDTFEELQVRLGKEGKNGKSIGQGGGEVAKFCGDVTEEVEGDDEHDMKKLCKGISEIIYFMNGIQPADNRYSKVIGAGTPKALSPASQYARCIVSMVTLFETYPPHCRFHYIMNYTADKIQAEAKGKYGRAGGTFDKCKNITAGDLIIGRTVLKDKIKQWVKEDWSKAATNSKGGGALDRVGQVLQVSTAYCPSGTHGKTKEDLKKTLSVREKGTITRLLGMDSSKKDVLEVLMADDSEHKLPESTLQTALTSAIQNGSSLNTDAINNLTQMVNDRAQIVEAEMCIKDNIDKDNNGNGKLCNRLSCISNYVNTTGTTVPGKTSTSTADALWKDVQTQVTDLVTTISANGGKNDETDGLCKDITCPNAGETDCVSKTTCKIMVKALKEVHKNVGGDQEHNRIFRPTMRCVILNALGEKLKQYARERGYACSVDKGIKKAFEFGESKRKEWCTQNGKTDVRYCEECKEQECFSTNVGGMKPRAVVFGMLNNDPNITKVKSTLEGLHKKATLCDRLHCAIDHWKTTKTATGTTTTAAATEKGTTAGNDEEFWKENGPMRTLWDELAGEMNTKGLTGNGPDCDKLPTNSEKAACKYLHAGLHKLYNPDTSTTGNNGILSGHPSLRRTLGCLLLKKYAEKMKVTSKCVIDSGIEKAFKAWNDNNYATCNGGASGKEPCVPCQWKEKDYEDCKINTNGSPTPVKDKLTEVQPQISTTATSTLLKINEMSTLCEYIRCAGPKWFKNRATPNGNSGGTPTPTKNWCDFWGDEGVKTPLEELFKHIASEGAKKENNSNTAICRSFGDGNPQSVERKACNHITAGLEHIKKITSSTTTKAGHQDDDKFFKQSMMCAALNLYADKIKEQTDKSCPIDEKRIEKMFNDWNNENKKNSSFLSSCSKEVYGCFLCSRQNSEFNNCKLSVANTLINKTSTSQNETCNKDSTEVTTQIDGLLNNEDKSSTNSINTTMKQTLDKITDMKSSFCTQVQCAIKKYGKNNKNIGPNGTVTWDALSNDIGRELTELLNNMNDATKQSDAAKYCNDDKPPWNTKGHTERRTNRAACLHFAAGLQHIYTHGNGYQTGQFKGPSFEQTMGCLFLKEYAKQLQTMAKEKKKGYSWVHPLCSIKEGIDHAFSKSEKIMDDTSPCKNNGNNSCFECKWNDNDYDNCKIGQDKVGNKVNEIFTESTKQTQIEKTLENTVCPILLTDLLTPFLPLAPVSIGLSAMAYYLWKYFGPLGKGGARFRRSPTEIPGPSVQEQVLDHVEEAGPHEYRLVKERKPRSVPTRTKRSGPVNRRTIIEIHFEVLDECQKGDTQLNQKDFLELLVQEFMGSEFMEEEEQVPKEELFMEGVSMESVPMESVPSLGSGLLV
ncbi:SICAvar, type I [Plasmodium knowlesi strain H]|uniref:SICAvar, type I n=3 Tax=Plasmodium knowlesi TaxID=5850 RepID=A0A679L0P7_PLAKH|nr:SICAvar, type I [Plasmodium knowlesi strain H]OTN66516.1 SICAvar type I [Plasmodium knowlesi]CAA9986267.1 SICAvar, type I [Plasmodium knowlesi strain H]SBO27196.1 SICAvar, type I [Plasmodium knowlesi strain H]VVS75741.1 SICAvar, type I [Plasmodium knowlesi strain H]